MTPDDIRAFRRRHCLKQSDLATLLGLSQRIIAGYEAGEVAPKRIFALALAQLDRELEPPRRSRLGPP